MMKVLEEAFVDVISAMCDILRRFSFPCIYLILFSYFFYQAYLAPKGKMSVAMVINGVGCKDLTAHDAKIGRTMAENLFCFGKR